mgnify:CR=1 FL=1
MKRFLVCCGVFVGLVGLTNCMKNDVVTPDAQSVDFTACIDDVDTKTALDGLKVNWVKDDEIGIQVSRNHTENAATSKATYPSTYGVYRLADDAAGSNVGRFTYNRGKETITGDEEFFAFYPAKYCQPNAGNGYFYVDFPTTQYYEDVIGENLPLPMYGVGTNRNVDFKYAGAVIKLRVWAEKELEAHSCVISADGLSKKGFTYYQGGWQSLQNAHYLDNFRMVMKSPLKISTDSSNPTEILMVIPLPGRKTLNNLKFSVNCTGGGAELKKKSGLLVEPGTMVTFPVTKLELESTRLFVDGFEGEFDLEWLKTAKDSVRVTMPSSAHLKEDVFQQIMEATRSLSFKDNHQITLDLSETTAWSSTIKGLDNDTKQYVGFCGGSNRDNGIKNVSEFRLPQGITQIGNRAFAYSDYTKVVVPASLAQIIGSPSNGCDKMVWEVAPGNESFKSDDKGALYDFAMTTLMVLNGGSGSAYTILDGTTTIREWALYENSVIESLTIPASVTTMSADCISGTPNLTTITCLGTTPAAIKANTRANRVGPKDTMKILSVPKGCVEAYTNDWKVLLDEGNWEVKEISK